MTPTPTPSDALPSDWLIQGALLYRLTDEARPTNCDEIRVTMADGSPGFGDDSCIRRAQQVLEVLNRRTPPASEQTDDIEQRARRLLEIEYEKVELTLSALRMRMGGRYIDDVEKAAVLAVSAALRSVEQPSAPEPVIVLDGVDEYGPVLHWHKPWVDFKAGTEFYIHPAPQHLCIVTDAMIEAALLSDATAHERWCGGAIPGEDVLMREALEAAERVRPAPQQRESATTTIANLSCKKCGDAVSVKFHYGDVPDELPKDAPLRPVSDEVSSLIAELHLLEEVCAFYANDEDRFLREDGEAYGLIPTEVGLKARAARKRFQERSRLAGEGA